MQIICTQSYDFKYTYLIQIICSQSYGFKYVFTQLLCYRQDLFLSIPDSHQVPMALCLHYPDTHIHTHTHTHTYIYIYIYYIYIYIYIYIIKSRCLHGFPWLPLFILAIIVHVSAAGFVFKYSQQTPIIFIPKDRLGSSALVRQLV